MGLTCFVRDSLLLGRQPEVHVTIAVQSGCEGAIDGINRRLSYLALQCDEVQGILRNPVSLCRTNVALTFESNQINRLLVSLR